MSSASFFLTAGKAGEKEMELHRRIHTGGT
ncbi:hypothetical protein ACVLD2_002739 [Paenibacillus sp. PvR052]